jgi:L,D-transpeptidase catalytic domain
MQHLVSRRTPLFLALLVAALAAPAAAHAAPSSSTNVTVDVGHLRGGKAQILAKLPIKGTVTPFVPGQTVDLLFFRNGHQVGSEKLDVHNGAGQSGSFQSDFTVRRDGRYAVQAIHEATAEQSGGASKRENFRVRFPSLHPGNCGPVVEALKKNLKKEGYVPSGGRCFRDKDSRAVLAYRKVNGNSHNSHAGAGIVKHIFSGHGAYHLKYPNDGKHVEVSIEHQVLVIADGDRPVQTYGVSTGKPSTPTVRGHFQFYSRQPGYNSEGMYYSTYFHGGYAVHGYASVPPNYPASHGCVRAPIPDAHHIFDSISLGEDIFIY